MRRLFRVVYSLNIKLLRGQLQNVAPNVKNQLSAGKYLDSNSAGSMPT